MKLVKFKKGDLFRYNRRHYLELYEDGYSWKDRFDVKLYESGKRPIGIILKRSDSLVELHYVFLNNKIGLLYADGADPI